MCKLCHRDTGSTKVCEPCRIGVNRVRRLINKDHTSLLKEELKHLNNYKEMFERNKESGGYVPKFYLEGETEHTCPRCLSKYKTASAKSICNDCARFENSYRQAVKRGKGNVTRKYEQHYQSLQLVGRPVPTLFEEETK